MKKITPVILLSFVLFSCSEYYKNQNIFNKALNLYSKPKSDKDLEEALKLYGSVINQKIYAAERMGIVYGILAERSLQSEQYGYAAKYYLEGLKIMPSKIGYHYGLGLAYANLYETSADKKQKSDFLIKAEDEIRYAVSKDPENGSYHATLATILGIYKGSAEEGINEINIALRYNPDNTEYLFLLARLEYDAKNFQKSITAYRRIIELSQDNYNVRKQAEENIARINSIGR